MAQPRASVASEIIISLKRLHRNEVVARISSRFKKSDRLHLLEAHSNIPDVRMPFPNICDSLRIPIRYIRGKSPSIIAAEVNCNLLRITSGVYPSCSNRVFGHAPIASKVNWNLLESHLTCVLNSRVQLTRIASKVYPTRSSRLFKPAPIAAEVNCNSLESHRKCIRLD